MLELSNISFGYRHSDATMMHSTVIDTLSLSIQPGETIALMGKSGVGKTTLSKIMCGLLTAQQGSVQLHNVPYTEPSTAISISFQESPFFPWLSVIDNVLFGVQKTDKNIAMGHYLLDAMGLKKYANRYPQTLSGGMRQRVSIARSLAVGSEYIILDEPFSALDPITKQELMNLIKKEQKHKKFGLILILHSIEDAYGLADNIYILQKQHISKKGNEYGNGQGDKQGNNKSLKHISTKDKSYDELHKKIIKYL